MLNPPGIGAAAIVAALAGAVLPVEPECPDGTVVVGSAPGSGGERYCGKPTAAGQMVRHGWYTAWFPNGRKAMEGEYREGVRAGQWLRFWDDGAKFEDLTFRNGLLDGPYRSWHRTGTPSASGTYRENWQDGHWVFWHETGARAAEGYYAAGLQEGRWTYWRPDGQVQGTGEYLDGAMRPADGEIDAASDMTARRTAFLDTRPPAPAVVVPELEVSVDPRIELLSAVLNLTLWPELGPWCAGDTDYAHAMKEAFGGMRDHGAVRLLDAMVQDGFTFDAPLRWILHYGPPPTLEPKVPLDPQVLRRAGGEKALAELAAAMRDFARDSRFMAFFEQHRSYFDRLARAYRHAAPEASVPALLESYFGSRRSGYHAIIAPMLGPRSYALRIGGTSAAEREILYAIGAPHGQHGGQFEFDPAGIRTALYRDFSRAFTEPAIEAAFGSGYRMDLYPLAKPDMDDLGLVTWRWVLTEMAARAAEIRLLRLHGFNSEARDLLRQGTAVERFAWLPYAVERFEQYEGERSRYPAFERFGSRFLGLLDETEPVLISGRLMFLLRR